MPPASAPRPSPLVFGRRPRNPAAAVRLVCLPFAGGSATAYAGIEAALADVAEVRTAELPGRGMRFGEAFATDLTVLAAQIAAAVLAMPDPGKPLVLFGHSMGALLAHEIARALARQENPPRHLVLSGAPAPQRRSAAARRALAEETRTDAGLVARMRRLGGTPPEIFAQPDLLALVLPVLRADYALVAGYAPPALPPLAVPATLLGGTEDAETPPADLVAWADGLAGSVAVEFWPGGHFFIRPNEARLAALLRAAIRTAAGGP
ncbi:thioesterase II family protein [Methylobacterium sp. ID0610]|uniref:thioesterase II family protein n=1 Tax=Methylobacterium carpenticola TaxID=3344827 RepID=UPI003683DC8E